MSDRHMMLRAGAVLAGLGWSAVAVALPWNLDMVDSDAIKAYEAEMRPLPEGVMSQDHLLTPAAYQKNWVRETAEGQALTNPYTTDDAFLAQGEKMYGVYCAPCHGGDGVNLGAVAAPGRYPAVAVLAGPTGRLKNLTDGHVYLTVRNGGGIMPRYGWAMNDSEMWSVVSYMRASFEDSAAPAPAPVEAAE